MNNEKVIIVEALMIIVLSANTAVLCAIIYLRGLKIKSLEDNVSSKADQIDQLIRNYSLLGSFIRLDLSNIRLVDSHLDEDINSPDNLFRRVYHFDDTEISTVIEFLKRQQLILFERKFNEIPIHSTSLEQLTALNTNQWLDSTNTARTISPEHFKEKCLQILELAIIDVTNYEELDQLRQQVISKWPPFSFWKESIDPWIQKKADDFSMDDLIVIENTIHDFLVQTIPDENNFSVIAAAPTRAITIFNREHITESQRELLKERFYPSFDIAWKQIREWANDPQKAAIFANLTIDYFKTYENPLVVAK